MNTYSVKLIVSVEEIIQMKAQRNTFCPRDDIYELFIRFHKYLNGNKFHLI